MRAITTIVIIAIFAMAQPIAAQPNNRPRVGKNIRHNFNDLQYRMIVDGIGLKEKEIEPFHKIYYDFLSTMEKTRTKELNPNLGAMAKPMTIAEQSDEEVEQMLLNSFEKSIKGTEIKREYYYKFREILTPKQIAQMYDIERRTREHFVREIRKREGDTEKTQHNISYFEE